jgi:uncharacterized protein YbaR (Trm112 family)
MLDLLCSPLSRAALRLADPGELVRINSQIQLRLIRNRDGSTLDAELDGALLCETEKVCYPIRDGLPVLIPGEGFDWPKNP